MWWKSWSWSMWRMFCRRIFWEWISLENTQVYINHKSITPHINKDYVPENVGEYNYLGVAPPYIVIYSYIVITFLKKNCAIIDVIFKKRKKRKKKKKICIT